MPCTTILVGKKASYDRSTMIARNDDGFFDEKKLIVVNPKDQPRKYVSKISHVEIELPDNPMKYTSTPSINQKNGIWAANGINEANVGMTATETTTSNPRVMGADPYVKYVKAENKKQKDIIGGIGEEDLVVLVLPYIKSAREGVLRLGALLEKYGTYESNGIAFNDENEIWWFESIGGHHWMAKRVEDDEYVIMPNQFGLDNFDFNDAYGKQEKNLCSKDLLEFVKDNHLDCNQDGKFNPRLAFGSHTEADHVYNTPRAWYMARYFNPRTYKWDGENADYTPESDDIPWSLKPEKKITIEEVKFILSSHFEGTPYNPYSNVTNPKKGIYRTIGISRTGCMAILQIRPYVEKELKGIEWICFGSNTFNCIVPMYTSVDKMPKYISEVELEINTNNLYWGSRLIGALADPNYGTCYQIIERYKNAVLNEGHRLLNVYDKKFKETKDIKVLLEANEENANFAQKQTNDCLSKVLLEASKNMKNSFKWSDN